MRRRKGLAGRRIPKARRFSRPEFCSIRKDASMRNAIVTRIEQPTIRLTDASDAKLPHVAQPLEVVPGVGGNAARHARIDPQRQTDDLVRR